ncbi:HD domain-containing protein [Patescibacteria group bacterium]|jgi:5'-deoxynucleotidase YfbR-like HD superfamily hydrolase|nr:HD domain-containing protein [Patescibacteria group bacterium]
MQKSLLAELVEHNLAYQSVRRRSITRDRLDCHALCEIGDECLQESLLDHVGQLPVTAVFLHPRIEHSLEIALPRVLHMLAIHDIGELVTGDLHPHHKNESNQREEYEAAQQMLDQGSHPMLEEYEAQQTLDARYAKSVDVLAGFVHDLSLPSEVTRRRIAHHAFTAEDIFERRKAVFAWDAILFELFEEVHQYYRKLEQLG